MGLKAREVSDMQRGIRNMGNQAMNNTKARKYKLYLLNNGLNKTSDRNRTKYETEAVIPLAMSVLYYFL